MGWILEPYPKRSLSSRPIYLACPPRPGGVGPTPESALGPLAHARARPPNEAAGVANRHSEVRTSSTSTLSLPISVRAPLDVRVQLRIIFLKSSRRNLRPARELRRCTQPSARTCCVPSRRFLCHRGRIYSCLISADRLWVFCSTWGTVLAVLLRCFHVVPALTA